MLLFSFSRLLHLALLAGSALAMTLNPRRFSITTWMTSGNYIGMRLFGATLDRRGILVVSNDGPGLRHPLEWWASVQLYGTVTTAEDSDFAAVSTRDGTQILVFFVRDDGALVYAQWTDAAPATDQWTLGTVGGGAAPAANSSLGAAMWAPDHMSVFYQDSAGNVFESEFANGMWARPATVATANLGTDINVVKTSDANGTLKALYVQEGANIMEWLSSASVDWHKTAITPAPGQSANYRFSVTYGSIHYTGADGGIGEMTGSAGQWQQRDELPWSWSYASPTSDVTTAPAYSNWVFVFYSVGDGTLWNQVNFPSWGWQPPSQLVPIQVWY